MNATAIKVGAGAWVFTGVVHDILSLILQSDSAATTSQIQVGPFSLNSALLHQGISLAMGLAMVVVGLLLWMITRDLPAERLRPYGVVALVASLAALGLAIAMIPGPPVFTFSVASIAFVIALAAKTRTAAPVENLQGAR